MTHPPTFFATRSYDPTVRERHMAELIDAGAEVPDPLSVFNATTFSKCMFAVICIGVVWGIVFAMGPT